VYFWVFVGDDDSHRRRRKIEGKKTFQIPWLFWSFQRRRMGSRAASGSGSWGDAPPLFLRLQKVFNAISGVLGAIL